MRPAAPGRFSTTICWPMFSEIFAATTRAAASTALAAASGAIHLMGLFG
jgi:hypothetical protein